MEELLGEQRERSFDVLVEDLEVDHHVLVPRVRVVLAAELARAPVERELVEAVGALEKHVLRHVGKARVATIGARTGADRDRYRRERTRHRIVEDRQIAVSQASRIREAPRHPHVARSTVPCRG